MKKPGPLYNALIDDPRVFPLPRAAETQSLASHWAALGQGEGQTGSGLGLFGLLDSKPSPIPSFYAQTRQLFLDQSSSQAVSVSSSSPEQNRTKPNDFTNLKNYVVAGEALTTTPLQIVRFSAFGFRIWRL
jgi:hypothetical protein